MTISLLQELGLSPNEARIYEALLTYGGSGVSSISLRAKVHRRNAYDALERLQSKGLVFEVQGKKEITYEPVEPGKLLELLKEKETRLEAELPGLIKTYRETRAPERAFIYKGVEGVKNYLRTALMKGEDMYILGAEGAWFDPRIASYTTWFLKEAAQKNMKFHVIFDHDAKEAPKFTDWLPAKDYKVLPEEYDTNSTMDIFGDYVVTYTGTEPGKLMDDVTIFVMHSPLLAKSYRAWWQYMWDSLPAPEKKAK